MKKYVFFDFNGTVIDDINLALDVLNMMLRKYEYKEKTRKEYLDAFGFPVYDYYDKVFDLSKESFDVLAAEFTDLYYNVCKTPVPIHEGFYQVIDWLHINGIKCVLLSATKQDLLERQIKTYKLEGCFDYVIGVRDIYATSKIKFGINFMKENNINPIDCIMIGDTIHDAEVSKALGIDFLIYTKGHQSRHRLIEYKLIDNLVEALNYLE